MKNLLLVLMLAVAALPARAEDNPPGRYQILSVSGGFVRLDTMTGAMMFCRDEIADLSCSAVPAGPKDADDEAASGTGERTEQVPRDKGTADDLEKALTFLERAMRSMMEMTGRRTPECAL